MGTFTPLLGLYKPAHLETGYDTLLNANLDLLDALGTTSGLANLLLASKFTGADAGAQIANALASLPGTGGTVIADVTGMVGTRVDITTPNTTIVIPAWVTLTKNANIDMFHVLANRSGITGAGTLDGNKASFTGSCVQILSGCDNPFLSGTGGRLTLKNAGDYGVYLSGITNARVTGFTASGCATNAVFGEVDANYCTVRDFQITHAGTQAAIAFHSHSGTASVHGTRISDGDIYTGIFGIEIDGVGGALPIGCVIGQNVRITSLTGGSVGGGISIAQCIDTTVGDFFYNANGNGASYIGLEIVGSHGTSVPGGVIKGDTTLSKGISINNSYCSTVGPVVVDGFDPSNTGYGVQVYSDHASGNANADGDYNCIDNHLTGTTVIFPATGTGGTGIDIVCASSLTHADRTQLVGCKVRGNTLGTNSKGIKLDNPSGGTVDKTLIVGCSNLDLTNAIYQNNDTNTTLSGNQ